MKKQEQKFTFKLIAHEEKFSQKLTHFKPTVYFLYSFKISENTRFQGVYKWNIGLKWVKNLNTAKTAQQTNIQKRKTKY